MLPLFGKYFRRTKKEDVAVGSTVKGPRQAGGSKSAVGGVPASMLSSEVFWGVRQFYITEAIFLYDHARHSIFC
jgi:hypothetical protein